MKSNRQLPDGILPPRRAPAKDIYDGALKERLGIVYIAVDDVRAPWSESLSLNNEVNNCVSVSFVPLKIIMRALFRLIICTFCNDISFKC